LHARILRINPEHIDIPLPNYATEGSAGMDICAAVEQDIEIQPGETSLIPSGFVIELRKDMKHSSTTKRPCHQA